MADDRSAAVQARDGPVGPGPWAGEALAREILAETPEDPDARAVLGAACAPEARWPRL